LPTGSFSIETFFAPTAGNSAFATTFSFSQDTGNFILGTEQRGGDGYANVDFGYQGNQTVVGGQVVPEVNGTLTDFLVTYDASTKIATAYNNGVQTGSTTVTNVAYASGSTTGPFNGIAGGGPFGDNGLAGSTQDFRIFSGVLSASQAVAEFNAGPDALSSAPVPEASTTISLGLLLILASGALTLKARKRKVMTA